MKNTPSRVCAKTAFVGWLSKEISRINYFHNLLSYNHYFRKCLRLVYRINVVLATLTTGMFLLFTYIFLVCGILRRWFACARTTYQVVSDCQTSRSSDLWDRQRALWRPQSHRDIVWSHRNKNKIDILNYSKNNCEIWRCQYSVEHNICDICICNSS
jgi:hypothetical protein